MGRLIPQARGSWRQEPLILFPSRLVSCCVMLYHGIMNNTMTDKQRQTAAIAMLLVTIGLAALTFALASI